LAADAEAKVQEASRANQLALKESGSAASQPSVGGAAPASGGAAEGGSAGVARDRTKEAEVLLEQAAEASLRADEAHKALAAKLTSLRPGSAEYRSTASQANDALVRAHAQMAELRKATISFEKASPPTRPVVAAPLGPPTISVARTEAT